MSLRLVFGAALAALIFPLASAVAQEGIKWGGYVKVDWFQDDRAVIGARDDMYLFYPAPRRQVTNAPAVLGQCINPVLQPDNPACLYIYGNNEDLNAVKQTHITAVQSRVNMTVPGPDAFGAKTSAFVEVDFFGTSNYLAWMTRLRHATVNLNWGETKLLVGMWWHPLFTLGYQPETVQFSPISPVHPFSRQPQVKLSQDLGGGLNLHVTLLYRGYHSDTGPATDIPAGDGVIPATSTSTTTCSVSGAQPANPNQQVTCTATTTTTTTTVPAYISRPKRWADRPDVDIQLEYKSDMFSGGITLDFNELRPYPRVVSYDGQTLDIALGNNKSKVNGFTWQIFAKIFFDKENNGHIRLNYVKGENLHHMLMLGGYAAKRSIVLDNLEALGVSPFEANAIRTFTKIEYTPVKITSYWIQPIWGKDIEYSIVVGKSTNDGTKDDSVGTRRAVLNIDYHARGTPTIKSVVAVVPQVRFLAGKSWIGVMYGIFDAEYLEDDKVFRLAYDYVKTQARIATTDYRTINLNGFVIPDPVIINTKGVPQKTYKVTDRRIQVSIQQNF